VSEGFEAMRKPAYVHNLIMCNEETGDIKQSYRWRDMGQSEDHITKYILAPEHEKALEVWFSLTYTKWMQGECGP
jgi:hypothetical protein